MFGKCFESVFESVGFENRKDICFEMEQVTRSNLPTQMSFLFIFFSFDTVVLPLIWQATISLDVSGMSVGHRIVMIAML